MTRRHLIRVLGVLWMVALVVAACGGGEDDGLTGTVTQPEGDVSASASTGSAAPAESGESGDGTESLDGADSGESAEGEAAPGLPVGAVPDDFVTVEGETARGPFLIDMPSPAEFDQSHNTAWPITTTTMWHDGDRTFVAVIDDFTQHIDDSWQSARAQEVYAHGPLGSLVFGVFTVDADVVEPGYPITHVLPGSDTEVLGYEYDLTVDGVPGRMRSIRLDRVHYGLVAYGVSVEEWDAFVDSLVTHEPLEPTPEEIEARVEADRIIAEAYGEQVFVDGPHEPRELHPATGGWGFVPGPPFGALAPGDDPRLDAEWDKCRSGDGFACDELYFESELGSVYETFGDSCGGRTVEVWPCTELLGGERHPSAEDPLLERRYTNHLGGYRLDVVPGPDSPPPGEYVPSDLLWMECGLLAQSQSCTDLINTASDHPYGLYGAYGWTCGGRTSFRENVSCSVLLTPEDELPQAGDPAPGTVPELDAAWESCAADVGTCRGISAARSELPDAESEEFEELIEPYLLFSFSCGGIYDRPMNWTSCTEKAGTDWPIGDDVASLPAQPVPPGSGG